MILTAKLETRSWYSSSRYPKLFREQYFSDSGDCQKIDNYSVCSMVIVKKNPPVYGVFTWDLCEVLARNIGHLSWVLCLNEPFKAIMWHVNDFHL